MPNEEGKCLVWMDFSKIYLISANLQPGAKILPSP